MAVNTLVPPIPQNPVAESQAWRDWFRSVGSYVSNAQLTGATGTFTSGGHTLTITNGIITNIT
jgi:hypothetical protein